MKLSFVASAVLVSLIAFNETVLAADIHPETPESNEQIERGMGAVKVHKNPAVTADELEMGMTKEQDDEPTRAIDNTPLTRTTASSAGGNHLFGLHAALGIPHPLSAGLNYVHSSHYFSAELSMGSFGATVSDTKIKLTNTEVALRWHPWAGSFYIGALYGNQKISAEKTEVIQGQTANGKVEVKSNYVTPHVGWAWGAQDNGFFTSIEFGYQSPSSVTTDFKTDVTNAAVLNDSEYVKLQQDVRDQGDKIGNMGLPHIVLFKIGWLF